jgi:hypothetical protein
MAGELVSCCVYKRGIIKLSTDQLQALDSHLTDGNSTLFFGWIVNLVKDNQKSQMAQTTEGRQCSQIHIAETKTLLPTSSSSYAFFS